MMYQAAEVNMIEVDEGTTGTGLTDPVDTEAGTAVHELIAMQESHAAVTAMNDMIAALVCQQV